MKEDKQLSWFLNPQLFIPIILLLLLAPLLFRFFMGAPLIPSPSSYLSLRAADALAIEGVPAYDVLQETTFAFNPYDLLLAFLRPFGQARILLSTILGLLSALLFQKLVSEFVKRKLERDLLSLLFVINPVFLALFTKLSPLTLALPIGLLALLLLQKRREKFIPLLLILLTLLSPLFNLFTLITLFTLCKTPTQRRMLLLTFVLNLLVMLFALLYLGFSFLPQDLFFFSNFIIEFGYVHGLSLFFASLAIIEGSILWAEQRTRIIFSFFLLLLLLVPFNETARLFAGLTAALFVASFIARLLRMKWILPRARWLTKLLIICLLIFLLLVQLKGITLQQPTGEFTSLLTHLPPGEGTVLAPPAFGHVIAHFTLHPVLLDTSSLSHRSLEAQQRLHDVELLYHSYRLDEAEELLNRYDIKFILITEKMRQGDVWNRDEEGLLFLLARSNRFLLRTESKNEALWLFLPSG